jgi:hypothetical protein
MGSMREEPMTVKELIAHLQTLDQDAGVFVYCIDSYYSIAVTKADIIEMDAFWLKPYVSTQIENEYGEKLARPIVRNVDSFWDLDYKDAGAAPAHERKIKAICFLAE